MASTLKSNSSEGCTSVRKQNDSLNSPQSFICPLTLQILKDPVMDQDGTTYERSAIVEWLSEHDNTSPITRKYLTCDDLVPNRALQETINSFMGTEWSNTVEKELLLNAMDKLFQRMNFEHSTRKMDRGPLRTPKSNTNDCPTNDNRGIINCYLREIGQIIGMRLRLNRQGVSALRYGKYSIVMEVPTMSNTLSVYSVILSRAEMERLGMSNVMKMALEINFLQAETKRACISLDKRNGGLLLSYSVLISKTSFSDFRTILEDFIGLIVSLGTTFQKVS